VSDTKTAILDAAEEGFARQGIHGVSLRAILLGARINPALAHYHFGSKENLLREILTRRMAPLSDERVRLLDELLSRQGDPPYTLREALHAFIAPAIRMIEEAPSFARFLGQIQGTWDRSLRAFYESSLAESLRRFVTAVDRISPPGLRGTRRLTRGFFFLGLLSWTLRNSERMEEMSRGRYRVPRGEELIDELVTFSEAGLLAGLEEEEGKEEGRV
jgi:AcrR family transcriptional regulator